MFYFGGGVVLEESLFWTDAILGFAGCLILSFVPAIGCRSVPPHQSGIPSSVSLCATISLVLVHERHCGFPSCVVALGLALVVVGRLAARVLSAVASMWLHFVVAGCSVLVLLEGRSLLIDPVCLMVFALEPLAVMCFVLKSHVSAFCFLLAAAH